MIADERVRETIGRRQIAQVLARVEEVEHRLHQRRTQREPASVEASRTRDELANARDQLREVEEQSELSRVEARDLLIRSRAEVHELLTRLEQFETHFVLGPALRGRRRLKMALEILKDRAAM